MRTRLAYKKSRTRLAARSTQGNPGEMTQSKPWEIGEPTEKASPTSIVRFTFGYPWALDTRALL